MENDIVQQEEKSEYQKLLDELRNLEDQKVEDLERSKSIDLGANLAKGLSQYALTRGAAKAGQSGGTTIRDTKLSTKPIDTFSKVLQEYKSKTGDIKKKAALLPKLSTPKVITQKVDGSLYERTPEGEWEEKVKGEKKSDVSKSKVITNSKTGEIVEVKDGKFSVIRQGKSLPKDDPSYDDPNSEESKTQQDFLLSSMRAIGGTFDENKTDAVRRLSGNFIKKNATGMIRKAEKELSKQRVEQSETRIGLAKNKLGLSKQRYSHTVKKTAKDFAEKNQNQVIGAQKALRNSIYTKTAKEIISNVPMLDSALSAAERGEETALAVLGVKMAKIMGEKGMLSETDVTRYTSASSLIGKAKASFMKYVSAKPSKDVSKSIKNMTKEMIDTSEGLLDKAINEHANLFAKAEGIGIDESKYLLDHRIKVKGGKKEQPKQVNKLNRSDKYSLMKTEFKNQINKDMDVETKKRLWKEIVNKYRGK
jgi:hypothetical protein